MMSVLNTVFNVAGVALLLLMAWIFIEMFRGGFGPGGCR